MDGILQGLFESVSLIRVGSVIDMDSIINTSNMGSTILIGMGVALAAFVLWGCAMCVIGGIYDIYLVFKYTYKGIAWLLGKRRH